MNREDKYAYKGIKIIFALVSVMLMFPQLLAGEDTYYRTFFVFMIGKVVDLFYKDERGNKLFFKIWDVINQLIGAGACAFAFCAMIDDFAKLFVSKIMEVNIILMVCVVSCMVRDVFELLFMAINIKLVEREISNNLKELQL